MVRQPSRAVVSALLGALLCGDPSLVAGAPSPSGTMRVQPGQRVSLDGHFPSVEATLRELCRRSGAELRSFDAPDRAFAVRVIDQPLVAALEVILSQENHLSGLRDPGTDGSAPIVRWVEVTGRKSGYVAPLATPGVDTAPSPRPVELVVGERLLRDPDAVRQWLESEPEALAQSLRHHPDAAGILRRLEAAAAPEVVQKLEAVIAELETMTASPK